MQGHRSEFNVFKCLFSAFWANDIVIIKILFLYFVMDEYINLLFPEQTFVLLIIKLYVETLVCWDFHAIIDQNFSQPFSGLSFNLWSYNVRTPWSDQTMLERNILTRPSSGPRQPLPRQLCDHISARPVILGIAQYPQSGKWSEVASIRDLRLEGFIIWIIVKAESLIGSER